MRWPLSVISPRSPPRGRNIMQDIIRTLPRGVRSGDRFELRIKLLFGPGKLPAVNTLAVTVCVAVYWVLQLFWWPPCHFCAKVQSMPPLSEQVNLHGQNVLHQGRQPIDIFLLSTSSSTSLPCICPIIKGLSSLSVPARSNNFPARLERNFPESPLNQSTLILNIRDLN